MKYNTLDRYFYTVDYYSWADTGTVNNPVITYTYDRTLRAKVVNDGTGRVFLYVPSTETLQLQGRFRNIKDRDGQILMPVPGSNQGQEYQITEREPLTNPFGYKVDVRYWGVKVENS